MERNEEMEYRITIKLKTNETKERTIEILNDCYIINDLEGEILGFPRGMIFLQFKEKDYTSLNIFDRLQIIWEDLTSRAGLPNAELFSLQIESMDLVEEINKNKI